MKSRVSGHYLKINDRVCCLPLQPLEAHLRPPGTDIFRLDLKFGGLLYGF